jgi:hypothetical protein
MCNPHNANGCCPKHKDMTVGNRRRHEATRDQLNCEAR